MTALREFQIVMTKPAGAVCNLDCRYCYYLAKQELYPGGAPHRMTDDLLEAYIVQHIQASPGTAITFAWHGGEPTVLGLDYFRTIVALQRKHRPPGRRIINNVQTNGTLLDNDWCRFLAAEDFFVGLSLDGPAELHDRYRVTRGGKPTHKAVLRGFRLLQRYGIRYDVLCVVHDENVRFPAAVYRFFKQLGVQSLQFLPLVEPRPEAPGGVSERTVPAEAFGAFLCAVFDEWVRQDVGRIAIQTFDEAARPACGLEHALCIFRETCGDVPVLEHNGDFYACDHFVDPAHRFGNIRETPLGALLECAAQQAFGRAKRDARPRYCRECEVLALCNGGCPQDRFIRTPDGEAGLNYLCAGYKRFFTHSRPALARLAALWRTGQPPERLMDWARAADAEARVRAGRNDPCPCGSGRKYKKCCFGRIAPA
ncbi:MAG: anaerobic sulfatase maturase [candidate division NC10 bacterium]|nr:anaerobic sulfatase maturase [candidate division NC10 bacterium]